MPDYIEREAILKAYEEEQRRDGPWRFETLTNSIPSADVAPVVHGYWVKPSTMAWEHYCSVCKGPKPYFYGYGSLGSSFCPNCGAKMDKEGDDGLDTP